MKKKKYLTELCCGSFASAVYCLGRTIYETTDFRGIQSSPLQYFLLFLAGSILAAGLFRLLHALVRKAGNCQRPEGGEKFFSHKRTYLLLWLLLIAVYVICYVSYYPGTFAYDAPPQTYQAFGRDLLNTHHPVLHTVLWGICLRLGARLAGGGTAGLVIYSIGEILVVTAVSVLVVYEIYRVTARAGAAVLASLYYLLVPMLSVMSFSLTKDVLFGCFLVLFILMLYEAAVQEKKGNLSGLFAAGLLSSLFRNNMIYVVILVFVMAFILRYSHKIKAVLFGIILTYCLIMKLVFPLVGVVEGEKCEAFPAVMVQLAGIYVNSPELLDQEEKETILSYMPDADSFNRHFADYVKSTFDNERYEEDSRTFWNTYFSVLRKAPVQCLCLFLDLNVDYWYPGAEIPDRYSMRAYIETDTQEKEIYPVENAGYLPKIHAFYEKVAAHELTIMNLPVLGYFFSLAFPFGSLLVCIHLTICDKRRENVLVLGVLAGLFLTFILGPVSNFRYLYPFYLALPLYFCFAAAGADRVREQKVSFRGLLW